MVCVCVCMRVHVSVQGVGCWECFCIAVVLVCVFIPSSPEEKHSFFNNLFGRRKGHTTSLEPPNPFARLCRHSRSFDGGETC